MVGQILRIGFANFFRPHHNHGLLPTLNQFEYFCSDCESGVERIEAFQATLFESRLSELTLHHERFIEVEEWFELFYQLDRKIASFFLQLQFFEDACPEFGPIKGNFSIPNRVDY